MHLTKDNRVPSLGRQQGLYCAAKSQITYFQSSMGKWQVWKSRIFFFFLRHAFICCRLVVWSSGFYIPRWDLNEQTVHLLKNIRPFQPTCYWSCRSERTSPGNRDITLGCYLHSRLGFSSQKEIKTWSGLSKLQVRRTQISNYLPTQHSALCQ